MREISIRTEGYQDTILLSHRFIDEHMPKANGEFVKVYLYLVRMLSKTPASFDLSKAADLFNCPERDIVRALKYWAKEQLLLLETENENTILNITLLPVPALKKEAPLLQKTEPVTAVPEQPKVQTLEGKQAEGKNYPPVQITRQKREELSQMEEIQQLLFLTEQYLGKTLTPGHVDRLLYFYDTLKFSVDLIEYLIEYCVSKGHPSMRYIETVAFAWADQGITTVEQAREESNRFNQEYYAILKAMGIKGRVPIESEIRYMDTWKNIYGFTLDIITEACSRTILQTGQYSFPYAQKILAEWNKNGVRSLADVEKLDLAHQRRKSQTSQSKQSAGNRFNNFNQRSYDFQEYEKMLLGQSSES